MIRIVSYPVLVWAMRDLLRRPLEALLLGAALAGVTLVIGIPLLFTQALDRSAAALLANAPALVIRRVDAGGWAPIPVREAVAAAGRVRGVIDARPRVWGVVSGPQGPLTIVGVHPPDGAGRPPLPVLPRPGEAVAGPGVPATGPAIPLTGQARRSVRIIHTLPRQTGLAAHDLLFLHPRDAAPLLGLLPGQASDLAVEVFHDDEAEALLSELAAAFPWPVRITTRKESMQRFAGGTTRQGGILAVMLVPALTTLCLIAGFTVREGLGRRPEIGLYKAMGWSAADILWWQLCRSLITGLPAVAAGGALAFLAVFWPGVTWPGRWFLGWPQGAPPLYLDPGGAGPGLLAAGLAVLVPYLAAALLPALKSTAEAPVRFLARGDAL